MTSDSTLHDSVMININNLASQDFKQLILDKSWSDLCVMLKGTADAKSLMKVGYTWRQASPWQRVMLDVSKKSKMPKLQSLIIACWILFPAKLQDLWDPCLPYSSLNISYLTLCSTHGGRRAHVSAGNESRTPQISHEKRETQIQLDLSKFKTKYLN